jgi:hypothetical protein
MAEESIIFAQSEGEKEKTTIAITTNGQVATTNFMNCGQPQSPTVR